MAGKRSRNRSVAKVVVVGAVALCVGLGLLGVLLTKKKEVVSLATRQLDTPSSIEVLIASQAIEEGTELVPTLFRKESRPSKDFPSGGVVNNFEQLRGVYSKSFVAAGSPLLVEHLTAQPPINSVVPKIRPGYRAITFKLDKQTTNEGWARAGVRVDVLLATNTLGQQSTAVVIAQNVRVLSSGTSVSSEFGGESKIIQDGESTVTLEVSTEDQKRLKLAAGRGVLRLLLRGDDDTTTSDERVRVSLDGVITIPGEAAKAAAPDQGWVTIDGRKYRVVGASLIPG